MFEINRQYKKYTPSYIKDQDAYEGQESVKAKGQSYLPMLAGQQVDKVHGQMLYDLYAKSALWFPATGATIKGYLGIMFRKDPIVELPKELDVISESFTDDGLTINALAKNLAKETMIRYRPAVLVDFPSTDTAGMSVAEVESLNLRPYAVLYNSIQIQHWHERVGNGIKKLDYVMLEEKHDIIKLFDTVTYSLMPMLYLNRVI